MGTAEMTVSIAAIIAIVGCLINVYGFFQSRKKNIQSEDNKMSEIREGIIKLNLKSDNMCQNLTELRVETRSQMKEISDKLCDHDKKIAVIERDLKTAFHRIDEIRKE